MTKATDEQVTEWAARHDLGGNLSEWRVIFEDAQTLNQCDGCMQRAEIRNGLHYGEDGKAFMACQRARYVSAAAPAAQPATPLREVLSDRLKLEAQGHAQEARTAKATIAEIYQLVTGATGEPGNWHGAQPVRAYIAEQRKLMEQARDSLEGACNWIKGDKWRYSKDASNREAWQLHHDNLSETLAALRSRLDGQKT